MEYVYELFFPHIKVCNGSEIIQILAVNLAVNIKLYFHFFTKNENSTCYLFDISKQTHINKLSCPF